MPCRVELRNRQIIKSVKNVLEANGALNKSSKIQLDDCVFNLFCSVSSQEVQTLLSEFASQITVVEHEEIPETSENFSLEGKIKLYLSHSNETFPDLDVSGLLSKVPKKWTVYPPMVLFNAGGFDSEVWQEAFLSFINKQDFFEYIKPAFPAIISHFAVNRPIIEEDILRRPFNIIPLHGDFGPEPNDQLFEQPQKSDLDSAFWCHCVQNGIYQTWAPRYTMFSRGNIKEKKRVLDKFQKLENLFVLDFYAGIGYFTLSYLANGATLLCWELNPWSIEGLVRGLAANGYKHKFVRKDEKLTKTVFEEEQKSGTRAFVFHESNENVINRLSLLGQLDISHINLGLLPTSQPSWPIVKAVREKYTQKIFQAHIHENEHKNNFEELKLKIGNFFSSDVHHLEKVKTFAPDVWHIVADVDVS